MNCPEDGEWEAFTKGGLDQERTREMEAHLEVCIECIERLSFARLARSALASSPGPQGSSHLDDLEVAAWLDGAMAAEAREAAGAHLAQCGECARTVLEAVRTADGATDTGTRVPPELLRKLFQQHGG